jgi:hypothetical protein
MMTTKYLPAKEGEIEGERRFMHIDGVRACAAGYANDPALVGYKANAAFQELDLLPSTVYNISVFVQYREPLVPCDC